MDNTRFRNHFKKKLLFLSSVGLFVASLCVAMISIWPLYNHLKDQQANKLIFAVKTKSMLVSQFLEKAEETSKQITSRSKARDFLEKYNTQEVGLVTFQEFSAPLLRDALTLSEFAVGINRFDIQGKSVVQVGIALPAKFLQEHKITNSKPTIQGPIRIGNTDVIAVTAPIVNREKKRVGTDVVIFTISKLAEIVQDYTGLGDNGETLLGRLQATGQLDLFFEMRADRESRSTTLLSRYVTIAQKAPQDTDVLRQGQVASLLKTPHDIAAYRQIKGTDWSIIVVMDKGELFRTITRVVLVIVLVIAIVIIPLGIVGIIFLLRPLSARILIHVETLQQEITAKENAIEQQNLSEEQLLNEKERLSVTLRSIGDGVITTDLDGCIMLMNKIAEKLTGWSQQEAKGKSLQNVFNIINEKTGQPCENPAQQVLRSKETVALANHTALIAKNGTQCSIEDSGAPIFNQESAIVGTVLVFRDVTEKRKTDAALVKVEKLESIGVLAGGIAHDFNNILAAILGNIELAGMSIDTTGTTYSLLQEAKKASLRAKDLTQQLLTFSKGGDPIRKTASIGSVITDSANFVLRGSAISCQFNIPQDLWLVNVDSGQVSQVVQNLIINAKAAMPEGGKIEIACANIDMCTSERRHHLPGKKYIKISIADGGCGISKKFLEKIFDPYFTTKQTGSGLGLAISHSIILKHNGSMEVTSEVGKGTVFTIYLPASSGQVIPGANPGSCAKDVAKARILIMDDDELVQRMAQQMIRCLGHEVLVVGDGEAAVRIFTEHLNSETPIDVVIMDLTVPGGMGGQAAIIELQKIDPAVKAIVSSGYSTDPVMANYKHYGFKAAIAKPFTLSDLSKVLFDVLSDS